MYKREIFEISENTLIAKNTYKMVLMGNTKDITAPGQFINIMINGFYLRRPISVCDYDDNSVTIIYKTVGKGTEAMSRLGLGVKLDVLTGLGNGFNTAKGGERPLLIGGGLGVAPMYALAKALLLEGKQVSVIIGFNTEREIVLEQELLDLGVNLAVVTADGSKGKAGFPTDAMCDFDYTYFYTCGPLPMLRAVSDASKTDGELSFEERMGCGFGACMGCSCETKYGNKRICRDGPVLTKEEVIW
ncbi:MAG: dihydroorotate dehydrogenase electron transfer subunit [Kiritimatiellae bacterium]|nr:dihydroorotate dehydrogenase electron transfer subunit [Kiritimatiellia bacterium]